MEKAAANAEWMEKPFLDTKIKTASTWLLLAGDPTNRPHWKHPDGKYRPYSPVYPVPVTVIDANGVRQIIRLKKVVWSNVPFKLQLEAIMAGGPGVPKFEVLARSQLDELTQKMETGVWTYDMQMSAEYYEKDKKGRDAFVRRTANAPNHYPDLKLRLLVRQAQDGMLGHLATEAPPPGEG